MMLYALHVDCAIAAEWYTCTHRPWQPPFLELHVGDNSTPAYKIKIREGSLEEK